MFEVRKGALHAESVPLEAIAREFGTPCYVYSCAVLAASGDVGRRPIHPGQLHFSSIQRNSRPR